MSGETYAQEGRFLEFLEGVGHDFEVDTGPGGIVLFKSGEWINLSAALEAAVSAVRRDEREKSAKAAKNAALCLERWPISEEQADEIFAEVMRAV